MGNIVLVLVVALVFGAVVFGVMTLVTGGDSGLTPAEPDSRARPLPGDRPLVEADVSNLTFDLAWRGYRMVQVDQTLRRLAYDLGYKTELIQVLEAEILALRDGRIEDADTLAHARISALAQKEAAGEFADQGASGGPISARLTTSTPAVAADEDAGPATDEGAGEPLAVEPGASDEVAPVPTGEARVEPAETDADTDAERLDGKAADTDVQDSGRPVATTARAGRDPR